MSSSTNGSPALLRPSKPASPIHTITPPSTGWSFSKKVLLVFIVLQLAVIAMMQWKFGGILQLVQWSSPTEMSPMVDKPINFLGAHIPVDIHRQHPTLGHTWEDSDDVRHVINPKDIAIGMGITSRGLHPRRKIQLWPFFSQLLTSFCKTVSTGYNYNFFLAYDYNDKFFTDDKLHEIFAKEFRDYTHQNCPASSVYSLHFVQCTHSGKPANAQNDAMMAAYMLNMAYYYRINDDTIMATKGWTELFIGALKKYDPPNVGVVGPNHKGGNTGILTYDFVSIDHVNIFGCYYPHVFTDWWGDSWISTVYLPGRVSKVSLTIIVSYQNSSKCALLDG